MMAEFMQLNLAIAAAHVQLISRSAHYVFEEYLYNTMVYRSMSSTVLT